MPRKNVSRTPVIFRRQKPQPEGQVFFVSQHQGYKKYLLNTGYVGHYETIKFLGPLS
jgi:hypothetical protein